MSRTAIPVQSIPRNAAAVLSWTPVDMADGMTFFNDSYSTVEIANNESASMTVTLHSVPCSHGRTGDITVTIASGHRGIIAPVKQELVNQAATPGMANLDFSVGSANSSVAVWTNQA